jgi:hypothetical protein
MTIKSYKLATAQALKTMKKHCNSDEFIKECRAAAHAKIEAATCKKGFLNWSKLPNLIGQNTKIKKDVASLQTDLEIWGLSLAPHWVSGFNTCNGLSMGCALNCLMFTGMGQKFMVASDGKHKVAIARIIRSILWFKYRDQFKARLLLEIERKAASLQNKNIAMAFRPNVFSEVKFEKTFPELFELCNDLNVKCYDYVKDIKRIKENPFPSYHMTFSLSENNALFIPTALKHGANVAIVTNLPTNKNRDKTYKHLPPKSLSVAGITLPTIDGDQHDARFLDKAKAAFIVLRGKGQTIKSDVTGFKHQIFEAA